MCKHRFQWFNAFPVASTYVPTRNDDIKMSNSDVNVTSNVIRLFDAIIARLKCVLLFMDIRIAFYKTRLTGKRVKLVPTLFI